MTTPAQTIEQHIQAAGADKAPRITLEDIEANIDAEFYFTADEAAQIHGAPAMTNFREKFARLECLTFCVLVLRNGFPVTGESAVASTENFNADIGRRLARENAINKVWPLMGYELRSKLAQGGAA